MPRHYITQAEAYVLKFIKGGKFQVENRQFYHDHITPTLISDITKTLGVDDAMELLQYIIDRIEIRYHRTKDRLRRYELDCYRSWLANAKGQIETAYYPERGNARLDTFMEAVKQIIARRRAQA